MLARIDEIPGVAESRVDRSGRRFLLTLDSGADEAEIVRRTRELIGSDAEVLDDATESEAVASRRRGDLWVNSAETIRLSLEEARILAVGMGEDAATALELSKEDTRRLVEAIEKEIGAAFARLHGRPDALQALAEEQSVIAARVLEAARAFLTPERHEALRRFLARHEGEPPG